MNDWRVCDLETGFRDIFRTSMTVNILNLVSRVESTSLFRIHSTLCTVREDNCGFLSFSFSLCARFPQETLMWLHRVRDYQRRCRHTSPPVPLYSHFCEKIGRSYRKTIRNWRALAAKHGMQYILISHVLPFFMVKKTFYVQKWYFSCTYIHISKMYVCMYMYMM